MLAKENVNQMSFVSRVKGCLGRDCPGDVKNLSKLSIYCTFKSVFETEL